MYCKIYFTDKPVFLCNDVSHELHEYLHHPDTIFIDEASRPALKSMLHEIDKKEFHSGIIYQPDLEKLKKDFFKLFTIVEAGGGLVMNEKKEILIIFRRGKWDLPKGKLDKGEKLEDCAVREVEEETGLTKIKLLSPLTITYHSYHEGARFILKESHWYNMKVSGMQKLVPQTTEDIHEIKWVGANELPPYLKNSYPSVADVLQLVMA